MKDLLAHLRCHIVNALAEVALILEDFMKS